MNSRKQEMLDLLMQHAPNHFTIDELCLSLNINTKSYYDWTRNRQDIRDAINEKLAKRFKMRRQETEDGNIVHVEISFKEAQKAKNHSFSEETRQQLVEIICYAYEKGVSIRESCRVLNIHPSTFFRWVDPNGALSFLYAVERYKEAKSTFNISLDESLTFTARNELAARLKTRTIKNTTYHFKTKGSNGEHKILEAVTEHERTVEPDLQTIALVLNNLDPEFGKATAGGQHIDSADIRYISDEELEAELQKEIERGKILRGEITQQNSNNLKNVDDEQQWFF